MASSTPTTRSRTLLFISYRDSTPRSRSHNPFDDNDDSEHSRLIQSDPHLALDLRQEDIPPWYPPILSHSKPSLTPLPSLPGQTSPIKSTPYSTQPVQKVRPKIRSPTNSPRLFFLPRRHFPRFFAFLFFFLFCSRSLHRRQFVIPLAYHQSPRSTSSTRNMYCPALRTGLLKNAKLKLSPRTSPACVHSSFRYHLFHPLCPPLGLC